MKRCRITIRQVVSRETFGLVPAGRNRKNNMNYVVTILTEKYLYRVNIEGGIKYTLGSGKKDLFPMSELGIDGQLGMCFNEKKQVLKLTAKTIPLSVKEINEEARLVHICGYPKMEVSFTRDTGEYPESYAIPYECQIHIGRSKKNDIVLNESYVSRNHLLITAEKGRIRIEDLESTYGTYLNGSPVKKAMLKSGDEIDICDLRMICKENRLYFYNLHEKPEFKYQKGINHPGMATNIVSSGSNSSVSMQTPNIEMEITDLVNLGSDPQAYMLYGSYRNEEEYKDEDGSYAEKHADDYDYMTLQLADSEEYEVQILPVELQADTDFLNSDLAGKTDEELKDEVGLTDQQISALHEYWQYNHMRANFVERKKYSEDGEYSYSTNNFFQFAYEVVGDKLYMGLEALITDEEDETKLEYYVQDREEWTEYSYGFDGLNLILSKDGKSTRLKSFSMLYAEKKNEGIYEWGYAENSTAGYDGIVHIAMSTEEGYDSSIEWADGKRAENVTAQIEGNQFALTWDSTYRYDYDLGEAEEGEGGKLTGIFLLTARPNGGADGGLSICVDGEWYPYVYDSTAYWNGELSDNLATDADVSSMSEQELGELKENQTAVSSGLMGAFKEQGLDSAKIDESTGTVQMDNNVLFALDKSKLTDEGKAYLDQFLAAYVPVISGAIEEGKVSTIVVEGYTDSAGDEAYNLKLSEERAQTVADYIKAGYPELANVIEVVGNGENNLILDGEGKEDAAASRRVEVRYVLKTE